MANVPLVLLDKNYSKAATSAANDVYAGKDITNPFKVAISKIIFLSLANLDVLKLC